MNTTTPRQTLHIALTLLLLPLSARPNRSHFPMSRDRENALESAFSAVRDDLRADMAVAVEDAEDRRLSERASPTFIFDTLSAKVGFIDFDFSRVRRLRLTIFSDAPAYSLQIPIDGIAVQHGQCRGLSGIKIQRKQPHNLALWAALMRERIACRFFIAMTVG